MTTQPDAATAVGASAPELHHRQLDGLAHEVWYVSAHEDTCQDAPALLRKVAQTLDDLDSGPDDVDLVSLTLENAVGDEGWSATLLVYRRRAPAKRTDDALARP